MDFKFKSFSCLFLYWGWSYSVDCIFKAILLNEKTMIHICNAYIWVNIKAASWSSGRVQDSGLGSRSSSGFNTLPVRLLVVPLSKALRAALLLSIQEEMGICEGRFVSRGAKLRVSGCILPRELRWLSIQIWTVKGPMTRECTCQSLQSRALSLDVDSKQWL